MDWSKFEEALRENARRVAAEQLKLPASAVASNAASGAAAIVLAMLADAVAAAR